MLQKPCDALETECKTFEASIKKMAVPAFYRPHEDTSLDTHIQKEQR